MTLLSRIVKANQYMNDPKIYEEVIFSNITQNLNKWNILKINPTNAYNKRIIGFKTILYN